MHQGLQLSQDLRQLLILSPQMQQSLALLQAPTLELQSMVARELEQNPVLEEAAPGPTSDKSEGETEAGPGDSLSTVDPAEPPADTQYDPATEKTGSQPVDDFQAEFDRLAQVDQDWRDNFASGNALRTTDVDEEKRQYLFDSLTADTSLQETLRDQVRVSELTAAQQAVAEVIIGNIGDTGYLKTPMEELSAAAGVPAPEVEAVLRVVQTFHPPGVAARDPRECLMLQLERVGKTYTLEYRILRDHFDELARRRIPELSRLTGYDLDAIQEAIHRIGHLEPLPGREFLPDNDVYVVPEIFVTRDEAGEFQVSLNEEHVPRLRISNFYKDRMGRQDASTEERDYIRDKIRAGKFFIESIQRRQQTIRRIAEEIVKWQRDFFDRGPEHLRPLTMKQVADVVGVHETTVSRAANGKYMQTPRGLFELRHFFTGGLATDSGEGMASSSVKQMVADIFKHEDGTKPLSDDQVVSLLQAKGVKIARRTVAKYRVELNILPSHLRRVY